MDAIYLDYNASVPSPEFLLKEIEKVLPKSLANPASLHSAGRGSRRLINIATEELAKFIDCEPEFIYWTSGASEANSWVLHSAFEWAKSKGRSQPAFLISGIEHESVHMAAKFYQGLGAVIETIPVDADGTVILEEYERILDSRPHWDLVSVMYANNETGVIQPVKKIIKKAKSRDIPTHVDAVQALGKIPFSVKHVGASYMTFSGHKLGALKGVGCVAIQAEGRVLTPLIHGKQQKSLRGGTENPLQTYCFGRVAQAYRTEELKLPDELAIWRDQFEDELGRRLDGVHIHGKNAKRLPNTSYIGFKEVDGDGILLNLDLEGVCASSGSACTSGSLDPSSVLLAMGCDKRMARSSIRLSSGQYTTWKDYERVLDVLPEIVERVRKA